MPKLRPGLPPTLATRAVAPARKPSPQPAIQAANAATSAGAANVAPPAAADTPNAMVMRGQYWEVRYNGQTLMLEDCRGLRYIALLLRDAQSSHGPIHAKELVALATGHDTKATEIERSDEVLDSVARKQLVDRLQAIATERNQACLVENFTRAAELDDEHERIADELTRAAGSAARGRRRGAFTHAGEKARKAVSKAITEAIAKVASHSGRPALAEHLASTIQKGQWLSYTGSASWHVDFHAPHPRK